MKRSTVLCALLPLLLVPACKQSEATGPIAAAILTNFETTDIAQLDSIRIVPSVLDQKGNLMLNATASFASADPLVATVAASGMVTSVGPAGRATISVRSGVATKQVTVVVRQTAARVVITPNPAVLRQRETLQLTAQLLDRTSTPVPNATFAFSTSNAQLATVSVDGMVTSVGPAGTVAIDVRAEGLTATAQITIAQVAARIAVTPNLASLGAGLTARLSAKVRDRVDSVMAEARVVWTNATPDIVSVSQDGSVRSLGGLGFTNLTARTLDGTVAEFVSFQIVTRFHPLGSRTQLISSLPLYAVRPYATDSAAGVSLSSALYVFNVADETSQRIDHEAAWGIALSPKRRTLYTAGNPYFLEEPREANGRFRNISFGGQLYDVVVNAAEDVAYVGLLDQGTIVAVDLETFLEGARVSTLTPPLHLTLATNGRLYVGGGPVWEIDIPNGRALRRVSNLSSQAIAISSDSRFLFAFAEGGSITKFDLIANAVVAVWQIPQCRAWGAALSPDDQVFVISCPTQNRVAYASATTGQILRTYDVPEPRRVSMTPDGTAAFVATRAGLFVVR